MKMSPVWNNFSEILSSASSAHHFLTAPPTTPPCQLCCAGTSSFSVSACRLPQKDVSVRVGFFEKTLLLFFNSVNIYQQPNFKSWNVPRIRRENFCEFFFKIFRENKFNLIAEKRKILFFGKNGGREINCDCFSVVVPVVCRRFGCFFVSDSAINPGLIGCLEDPSSDNGTLFKQIEVRFFKNLISIFPGIPVCFG
jgi:hypothetical protein